jgi:Holliday junction resolvasome RuvABC endonuclease subunit
MALALDFGVVALGIDQSLNGTGLCLLDNGRPSFMGTIKLDTHDGQHRLHAIVEEIRSLVGRHDPDIVAMEDTTAQAHSASIKPLIELAGVIKYELFKLGYHCGREQVLHGRHCLMIQNQSTMKKFCLGSGAVKKDARYLLEVFERLRVNFADDNQADAYMHAWMAVIVRGVLQGKIEITNLTGYQQEALIGPGVRQKKGLSMAKAMKLPPEEMIKLVGF